MLKHALAPLAALLLITGPAAGQINGALPFSTTNGTLALTSQGQTLTMPLPDWAAAAEGDEAVSALVSTRFLEEQGQAHLEIYPRGEGEAFWTRISGARLSSQASLSLADFRAVVINVYAQSCRPDAVALFQFEQDEPDYLPPVGYVCGAYLDDFEAFAGQGEVMIMGFYKSANGVGMVYQEWRGDAFDTEDPASWPVSPDAVEAYMGRLKSDVSLIAAD